MADRAHCHRCDRPLAGIGADGCTVIAELAALCNGSGSRASYRAAQAECERRGEELRSAGVRRG